MSNGNKKIYLDYAAATPVDGRVSKLVSGLSAEFFGNPSSVHEFGLAAKKVLEDARKKIAKLLAVKFDEIFFVNSGTESDNLAILGTARANRKYGKHIITSNAEHLAVLNASRQLEEEGFEITYLPVAEDGLLDSFLIKKSLRKDTILVSIMQANNEIGIIQPIKEIGALIKEWRQKNSSSFPYFHTDACQTAGFLSVQPNNLCVDLLSFNGSKIYGPRGIGCLYKKNRVNLEPLVFGGSQERGLKAGTENVALAAGLALALEISEKSKKTETKRLEKLRDYFIENCFKEIPDSKLNGHAKKRLPNNINISFKNVGGEMLMLALVQKGIAVSTGSACTTSETDVSHVIKAIGGDKKWGNIRVSLGRETTMNDMKEALRILKKEVQRIRKIS